MSAVESAQRAARITDPVSHGVGMLAMIGGMVVGAVVGAILVAGAIATGGALLIAVAAFAAVGCVAGGGLAAGQLARGFKKAMGLPDPQTGLLGPLASVNVRIGKLFAARVTDTAVACDGLKGCMHFPMPLAAIAEGAKTVRINNLFAARVTSKLVCGAAIKDGEPTVVIGGPTVRVLPVDDPEETLQKVLGVAMVVSLLGVVLLDPAAIVPILGFMVVNEAVGELADAIWGPDSGARDIAQGVLGLGTLIWMGARGAKELEEPSDQPLPGRGSSDAPVRDVKLDELRYTQRTAGGRGRADALRQSMGKDGWNGDPIDVVETPDGMVTLDNTRPAVANELGMDTVPARVHQPNDPLPESMMNPPRFVDKSTGEPATTWGEAAATRSGNQNPPLPATGTATPPRLPPSKE